MVLASLHITTSFVFEKYVLYTIGRFKLTNIINISLLSSSCLVFDQIGFEMCDMKVHFLSLF